jgi:hypothetical protein
MPESVRPLCPLEAMHVDERSRAVITVEVDGDLDLAALNAAWSRTLAAHPTVDSRIISHDGGYALEPLGSDQPGVTELAAGGDVVTTVASTALPVGGPVARLFARVRGSAATVGLIVDHVVTDGRSAMALSATLWRHYAEVRAGKPAEPAVTDWPATLSSRLPAVDEVAVAALLAQRLDRAARQPLPLLPYTAAGADAPPAGQQPVHNARFTLTAERTADLAAGARSLGTSVHGVTAAALLLAVRDELGEPTGSTLGCLSPVDLRTRVTPPASVREMLSFVSSFPDVVDMAGSGDAAHVGALGRRITGNLRAGLADGGWARETALLGHLDEHPELLDTTVFVSNVGRLTGPPSPPGLRLHDTRLNAGREDYYPQFGLGPLFACVTAIDGVFAVDLPYSPVCFAPEQMQRLSDRTLATLDQVVAASAALPA